MCMQCSSIKALFETTGDNPHVNYMPTILFLNGLESNNTIELYAGDCKLSEALSILNEEKHYTVCHYLKCILLMHLKIVFVWIFCNCCCARQSV